MILRATRHVTEAPGRAGTLLGRQRRMAAIVEPLCRLRQGRQASRPMQAGLANALTAIPSPN